MRTISLLLVALTLALAGCTDADESTDDNAGDTNGGGGSLSDQVTVVEPGAGNDTTGNDTAGNDTMTNDTSGNMTTNATTG